MHTVKDAFIRFPGVSLAWKAKRNERGTNNNAAHVEFLFCHITTGVPQNFFLPGLYFIASKIQESHALPFAFLQAKFDEALPSAGRYLYGLKDFHASQIMAQRRSIVIIGGGVFGASTAREIRKMMPDSKVTIVDIMPFPSASSASSDYNKIIRADYQDPFYMKLALEAQEFWRSDPLYQPFYHESGMLYAEKKGVASDFLRNYRSLGVQPVSEILSPQEARSRFGGAFRDSNWTGVEENYWNPRSGWGEGDAALKSLVQAGISEGVAYRVASVSSIAFDDDGSCRGVLLDNGEKLPADHVIVAAGAWTPKLLADSAPSRKDFHVGSKMIAAGAIQCNATFPSDQAAKLKSAPVMSTGMPHTDGS